MSFMDELIRDRDSLKAELDDLKANTVGAFYHATELDKIEKDRDRWKALAEKMAEKIEEAKAPLGSGKCACEGCEVEGEDAVESLDEALALYEAEKGKDAKGV